MIRRHTFSENLISGLIGVVIGLPIALYAQDHRSPAVYPAPAPTVYIVNEDAPKEQISTDPDIVDTEVISPIDKYALEDINLMARIVRAEAGNQTLHGKRLVADVILNRVDSEDFPDNVQDVIFQTNQFSTTTDGALERADQTVTGEDYRAVELEIESRTDTTILYFTAGNYNSCGTPAYRCGAHYFSTK